MTFANTGAAWVGGEAVVYVGGTANRVDMTRTRFDMRGALTACIQQNRQVAGVVTDATQIVLVDTVIEGCASGVQLREGRPRFEMTGGAIRGSTSYWGIHAGRVGFDSSPENQFGSPFIRLRGVTIADNYSGSILMNNGGELDIDGGVFASAASGIELLAVQRYTAKIAQREPAVGNARCAVRRRRRGIDLRLRHGGGPGRQHARQHLALDASPAHRHRGRRARRRRGQPLAADDAGLGLRGALRSGELGLRRGEPVRRDRRTTTLLGTNFRFLNAGPGASLRLAGP